MSGIPYTVIRCTGKDAFAFLQAQLASDVNTASRDKPVRSAWCNPKGRVICTPSLLAIDEGYSLTVPADLAELVVQRLLLFRFRSKVEFAAEDAGSRSAEERLLLLREGIVDIDHSQAEKFTPHMLNLDLLHIVSLDKGCYPGQEIVARTHYRGASRRRCLRFDSAAPVAAGDKVAADGRDIGEVVNAIGTELLAVIPVEQADEPLFVGDAALSRRDLPYSIGP